MLNLLLYRPGHSGFSRYVERVVPHLKGHRLWLCDEDLSGASRVDANIPQDLPASRLQRLLLGLSLSQHGVDVRRRLSRSEWARVEAVYSPFLDYLFCCPRLPQLITCHDLTPLVYPGSRRAYLRYRLWTPVHLHRATHVIAISCFVADQLLRLGVPHGKITVVHNGIECSNSPLLRSASFDWLVLARHDRNKNVAQVIRAYARFLASRPDWPGLLRVVGRNGRQTVRLRRLVGELGLRNKVELIPFVEQCRLQQYMRGAFALISTSLMEGFDYPVLEAQAEGLPTLVSDIPVHRELYGGSSLFFEAGDEPGSLARAMLDLAVDASLWRELSFAGHRRAMQLSLEEQVSGIKALMNQIVD